MMTSTTQSYDFKGKRMRLEIKDKETCVHRHIYVKSSASVGDMELELEACHVPKTCTIQVRTDDGVIHRAGQLARANREYVEAHINDYRQDIYNFWSAYTKIGRAFEAMDWDWISTRRHLLAGLWIQFSMDGYEFSWEFINKMEQNMCACK